jgi:hypothetical protein
MSSRFVGDVAVLISVIVLVTIMARAYRRSRTSQLNQTDPEYLEDVSSEPTPEEVRVAEASIQAKTNAAVAQAKKYFMRSLLLFVGLTLASWPFMYGRPLHVYFRPWGQLLIACSSLAFSLLLITSVGFLTNWWYRRKMRDLVHSLTDAD